MALQRMPAPAPVAAGSAPAAPSVSSTSSGPALSTRETIARPFVELGVMFGQALGGREPVLQALTNLQAIGQEHGCDAIIAVKLMHYPTTAGPAIVAYGTGIRFVPAPGAGMPATPATGGTATSGPDTAGQEAPPEAAPDNAPAMAAGAPAT
jgi:hypothetical protein